MGPSLRTNSFHKQVVGPVLPHAQTIQFAVLLLPANENIKYACLASVPLSTFFPSSPPHPSKIWSSLSSTLTPLAAMQRTCPPTSYSLPLKNLKPQAVVLVPISFLGGSSTFLATLSVAAVFQPVPQPYSFLETHPVPLGPEESV